MKPEHPQQWIHAIDCPCATCEWARPSADEEQLDWVQLSRLAFYGLIAGIAVGFMYDTPRTAQLLLVLVGL